MPSNKILIETLAAEGHLKTPRLIEAFLKIDRIHFVPENLKNKAYVNEPLPIGFGQTISQPLTVAFMLELLDPRPGDRILEIGAGSGWKTAILSHVVSANAAGSMPNKGTKEGIDDFKSPGLGFVVAIERIKELREMAVQNVSKFNFIKSGVATILHGDGSKGYAEKAPFDKIIAAATTSAVPLALKAQVRIGGRIVVPIEDSIVVIDKKSALNFAVKEYYGFRFVPLITGTMGDTGGG